jgi:hypothetical protein
VTILVPFLVFRNSKLPFTKQLYQINCGCKYDVRRPTSVAIWLLLLLTICLAVGGLRWVELHTSCP